MTPMPADTDWNTYINNLNQIAKKLNENGYVDYKQELPNTMKEVREVWQLLKQYLQKQA